MTDLLDAMDNEGLEFTSAREAGEVEGWLNTGNYALNYVISNRLQRGYPLGHTVEIFGDPSTGKSFLVKRAIAEAQRAGGAAFLDDTEGAFNPDWAERALGVDPDVLGLRRSNTVEDHEQLCTAFVDVVQRLADADDPAPYLLSCDSLALLTTQEELEDDFGDPGMHGARRAKMIRRLFREVGSKVADLPVVYIATNHTIADIGNPFGTGKTTPGGSGPKFQASVRLSLRKPKKIKRDGEVTAVRIRAVVDKNRLAPPFRETVMAIPFDRPISPYSGLIPILLGAGLIDTTAGHTIEYEGEDTGIYAQKNDTLKQDASAEKFVDRYPEIIDIADEYFAEQEEQVALDRDEDE